MVWSSRVVWLYQTERSTSIGVTLSRDVYAERVTDQAQETTYFDPDGLPITLDEWAAWIGSKRRPTRLSRVVDRELKTIYLGLVDPSLPGTRLYGTAVMDLTDGGPVEVDVYDSKEQAYESHDRHRKAMAEGFHCFRCKIGEQHP